MDKYDYLIVGSGLLGLVFAYEANKRGKKCIIIEKRSECGGNLYCDKVEKINVHKYGAHIFHTSNEKVWKYINELVEMKGFINSPLANYKGEIYNLPFNMNTFYQLWRTKTPKEAMEKINEQINEVKINYEPRNLEEQALKLVGKDIYEKLIKGYTEKQWGKRASELPAFIIKRIPVRFVYDNNYFNDKYQGIPEGGYNVLIRKLSENIEIKTNVNFFDSRNELEKLADKILYTGMIDKFYNYKFGALEYRSLKFENEVLNEENYQGNAVVNYTDYDVPYTRIIEHKHFEKISSNKTVITKEYPKAWENGDEPYYPINDNKNSYTYEKYKYIADREEKVIFGGRLAEYKYYDMDKTIERALELVAKELDD